MHYKHVVLKINSEMAADANCRLANHLSIIYPKRSMLYKNSGNKMLPGESRAEEASAVEPILNPQIIAEAKEELAAKRLSGKKYRPIIPTETHPPIDINRQTMEKYRPLMERHYETCE